MLKVRTKNVYSNLNIICIIIQSLFLVFIVSKEKNKKIKRNEFMYKKEDIPIAVEGVKLGKPLRQVAAKYKIPPTTLHNKVKNIAPINAKKGS